MRSRWITAATIGTIACLGMAASASAQSRPYVNSAPTTNGTAIVNNTLTSTGGQAGGPSGTTVGRAWLRCTNATDERTCELIDGAWNTSSYKLVRRRPRQAHAVGAVRLPGLSARSRVEDVAGDRRGRQSPGADTDAEATGRRRHPRRSPPRPSGTHRDPGPGRHPATDAGAGPAGRPAAADRAGTGARHGRGRAEQDRGEADAAVPHRAHQRRADHQRRTDLAPDRARRPRARRSRSSAPGRAARSAASPAPRRPGWSTSRSSRPTCAPA